MVEAVELQFVAIRVLTPRDKKAAPLGIVGVGKESEPVEIVDRQGAFGQCAEGFVEVGRVIKGVALHENGEGGEGLVTFGEMVEISVGFPALVGQPYSTAGTIALVVDRDLEVFRHASEPGQVLNMAGYDELKDRQFGVHVPGGVLRLGTPGWWFPGKSGWRAGWSLLPWIARKAIAAVLMVLACKRAVIPGSRW